MPTKKKIVRYSIKKPKKGKAFRVPIIVLVIKLLFFIPIHFTGGFAGRDSYGHISVFHYLKYLIRGKHGVDYYDYHLMWGKMILEAILVFVLALIIWFIVYIIFIDKKGEKKNV